MSNNSPKKAPPSTFEAVLEVMNQYVKTRSELESKKPPEQKALEAEQRAIQAKRRSTDAHKKEYLRISTLFDFWLKRDTWLIYDEAMPLVNGEKPEEEFLFNPRDEKLWSLIQSCAGHTLPLTNPEASPKQWRVNPFEWVRWLKLKEQYIHPQLAALIYPKTEIQPMLKTTKATQSREIIKRNRQKLIKDFAEDVDMRAKKQNVNWDNKAIPVTKSDFLEVFGKVNSEFKKISMDTFNRDIADIGIKFKRGTKSNKNNVLKILFSTS